MAKNITRTVNSTQKQPPAALLPENTSSGGEDQRLSLYLERKKDRPPKVNSTRIEDEGDCVTLLARYSEAMGSVSDDFRDLLFKQLLPLVPSGIDKGTFLNAALAFMHGLKPKDETEGIIAAQLFSLHSLAMSIMARACAAEYYGLLNLNVKMADKVLRAFRDGIGTLQRFRGKGSRQTVVVERVDVRQGGQAIVGAVNRTGGRWRGAAMKMKKGPHAKDKKASLFVRSALWRENPERYSLPSPCNAERTLPDARRQEHRPKNRGRPETVRRSNLTFRLYVNAPLLLSLAGP